MKAFITKYALTQGIYEIEAEICHSINPDMISNINRQNNCYHGEGKDWHRTKESAIERANAMRATKIKNLQKQISKLEKLEFQ